VYHKNNSCVHNYFSLENYQLCAILFLIPQREVLGMTVLDLALEQARRRQGLPVPAKRRLLREAVSLRQFDLAQALGVSHAAISRWEYGLRLPRGRQFNTYMSLLRLAKESTKRGNGAGL